MTREGGPDVRQSRVDNHSEGLSFGIVLGLVFGLDVFLALPQSVEFAEERVVSIVDDFEIDHRFEEIVQTRKFYLLRDGLVDPIVERNEYRP